MVLSIHAVILILIVTLAAIIDVYKRIIPNWLTYPALICGLVFGFLPDSGPTITNSLLGFAIAFFPALLMFVLNSLGGGDVKLLAAIGAWIGFPMIVDVLVYSAIAGGGMALILIIWKGLFWSLIKEFFIKLFSKKSNTALTINKMRIPFGVAIALGTGWALFLPPYY